MKRIIGVRFKRLGKPGIVNVYEFDFEKVKQDLRILIFEEYNTEWLDFIIKCRNGELIYQDYDVIAGGIADDKVSKWLEVEPVARFLLSISFIELAMPSSLGRPQ